MEAEPERWKRAAAERALALVRDGMLLGLGTGSTAHHFITGLRDLTARGLRLRGLATSLTSAELGRESGVEMLPVEAALPRSLDLAVDGADEIAPDLSLVKGRGGAMFREKLVALNAERFVVIADASKLVDRLGRGVVPVEVAPFLWPQTARRLEALGASWLLRGGTEQPYLTDNGNLILDLSFAGGLERPEQTAAVLKSVPGVIEHGLFCGLTQAAIVAGPGGLQILGSLA
ncbi:MAG: ribose-5-phosphate isomerase RpiA [Candidatus Dormibacteraeota bacterium]|nr:ribose-5-phosphate isomerase RpiA [Candidatus Dormibacteraeota bacterium]